MYHSTKKFSRQGLGVLLVETTNGKFVLLGLLVRMYEDSLVVTVEGLVLELESPHTLSAFD